MQWQIDKQKAKDKQELYRKHGSLAGAVGANVPKADGANLARGPVVATPEVRSPSVIAFEKFLKVLFYTILVFFGGILLARKLAPEALKEFNRRFNPLALAPVSEPVFTEKIRAEDESFSRFLTVLRVGPAVSADTGVPEKGIPVAEFYARAAKLLARQRTLLHAIGHEPDVYARQKMLVKLHAEMGSLKDAAGFPEMLPAWQVASAMEGLLKQLTEKTGHVTLSTLRAVAGGVDLLEKLCVPGLPAGLLAERPLKFLVVDDDLISRQAMSLALKKAFGQPDVAVDGETALIQAGQQAYDVIFLDVQLPDMDGFEICTKIHDTAVNRATPVIFVTSLSDFDARAKSVLSGGNDLMGKPFLTFEITVKALTLALRGRLEEQAQKPLPKSEPVRGKVDSSVTITDSPRTVTSFEIAARPEFTTADSPEPDDVTDAFLARLAIHLDSLRELGRIMLQIPDAEARQARLVDAFLRINSLIARDGMAVKHPAYQVSTALEGLFKKMMQDPKHSTPSILATVASAVDLLGDLCAPGLPPDLATDPTIHMLVVDDDLVARRVIVGALQTSFARPDSVENGEIALALAQEKPFDVIFLDVVMPGLDGFEVCARIREHGPNRDTPIVFVTAHGDFETRAQVARTGGNDLLAKPFLTAEITVKALTFALRGRLDRMKALPKFTNTALLRGKA